MNFDNFLAETAALAGLAGVLAGFSLSAVIELLAGEVRSKLSTAVVVVFALASMMFLFPLITSVFSLAVGAELGRIPSELDDWNSLAFLILLAALNVFLVGLGMAGWVRSKLAGWLTTTFAFIAFLLISSFTLFALFTLGTA